MEGCVDVALPSGSPQSGTVPWGKMHTGKNAITDHCDMVINKVGATGVNSLTRVGTGPRIQWLYGEQVGNWIQFLKTSLWPDLGKEGTDR